MVAAMIHAAAAVLVLVLAVPQASYGHSLAKQEDSPFGEVCYDGIGCFRNEGIFFDWTNRPVLLLPQSPSKIDTKFMLFTRSNRNSGQRVVFNQAGSLSGSKFDGRRQSKFLIHGYMSNPNTNWAPVMKDALLNTGDYNVFIVDWSNANGPIYSQATANIRVVGAVTAQMIEWLHSQTGASIRDMHILGHSLGAHAAGHAGERLSQLGRITGMDPAGPYFGGVHPDVRLDPTDARFVDVIHTDGTSIFKGGFGLYEPMGHLDFYPNGGKKQPGCTKNPIISIIDNGRQFSITCNHVRASPLVTATITNSNGDYRAVECPSYQDFKDGKCTCANSLCVSMGIKASEWRQDGRSNIRLYLDTSAQSPFQL